MRSASLRVRTGGFGRPAPPTASVPTIPTTMRRCCAADTTSGPSANIRSEIATHMRTDPYPKRCGRCGMDKPLDRFHRAEDGHQPWCKSCKREYAAAYYQANRERRQHRTSVDMRSSCGGTSGSRQVDRAPIAARRFTLLRCNGITFPAARRRLTSPSLRGVAVEGAYWPRLQSASSSAPTATRFARTPGAVPASVLRRETLRRNHPYC